MFGGNLRVKRVSREVIDAWPLKGSGLPVRVVNSGESVGIQTIGALRSWPTSKLMKLRSLGRISIRNIQTFFEICEQIEKGTLNFLHIKEVFELFLDQDECTVLTYRYGLDVEGINASRKSMTLQEIGNRTNRTRERVRQIEETAREKLQSKLAALCLQPLYDLFSQTIEALGKGTYCSEIQDRIDTPALAQYNVCAILLLFCDLHPEIITYYNGVFSTLSEKELKQIETVAIAHLETVHSPVPLDEIYHLVAARIPFVQGTGLQKVLEVLLDHNGPVAATINNHFFLYTQATGCFLKQLMQPMNKPIHFRDITRQCNSQLKPQSQKGAGFILETLNSHPDFERIDRGIYTIKQG